MKNKKYLIPEVTIITFTDEDIIANASSGDVLTPPSMDEPEIPGDD